MFTDSCLREATFNSNKEVVPERSSPTSHNSSCGREGSAGRETEGLREAMDEQKRDVSMTSDNIIKLQAKPGYYPLSEGKIVFNVVIFINFCGVKFGLGKIFLWL